MLGEWRAPFGTAGFARMVELAGAEAKLPFKVQPHMLRHAGAAGVSGSSQHPTHGEVLTPTRLKNLWRQ